jgi:Polysaccharide pyruvyl transferase
MALSVTRVIYYTGVANIGDLANAEIVSAVGGYPTWQAPDLCEQHILAVGSTLDSAAPNSVVWGTGMMHPDRGAGSVLAENIFAVRGKLTACALRKQGVAIQDVPLGDPAFALPALLNIQCTADAQARLGIVAHYADRDHPEFLRLKSEHEVLDLNVHETSLASFLQKMAGCHTVISSSLHGLIFAEALGIPNLWVEVGNGLPGGRFKFADWFSTTRKPAHAPRGLAGQSVAELRSEARLHDSNVTAQDVTASFPHGRLEGCQRQLADAAEYLPFEACRGHPTPIFIDIDVNEGALRRSFLSAGIVSRSVVFVACGVERRRAYAIAGECGISISPFHAETPFARGALLAFFSNWAEPTRYGILAAGSALAHFEPLGRLDRLLDVNPQVTEVNASTPSGDRLSYRRAGLFDIPANSIDVTMDAVHQGFT